MKHGERLMERRSFSLNGCNHRKLEKVNVDLSNNYKFFKYNKEKFNEDNVLITVVDTRKKKRLMVDGLHKAAALTMAYEKKINITEIKII
jgi:hypothetical protein